MAVTPRLGLPLIAAAQAQKHVTHNAALILLDAMAQCVVKDIGINDPPASPAAGDCYIVGASPTGTLASASGQIAVYDGYAWQFVQPRRGFLVFNTTSMRFCFFDGSVWQNFFSAFNSPNQFDALGIGTLPDATNSFAAKLNATLFTAKTTGEGGSGDLRMTLNKEAQARTLSQLYQSNYSGRAETGLTGDDNFHVKLSSDGSNWKEALIGYAASGAVRIDQLLLARSASANKGRIECDFTAPNSLGAVFSDTNAAATSTAVSFRKNNTQVGTIQLTSTGTNYATTSDYRVKDVKGPLSNPLARVAALNPVRFTFKSDPNRELDGFLAHEVAAVVPEAVSGEKDFCDPDGRPVLQGLDAARLVPLIVAALQELIARLAAIEAKQP